MENSGADACAYDVGDEVYPVSASARDEVFLYDLGHPSIDDADE